MGGHSLDFYNLEESDLDSAARQFFRVSICENDKYFVKVDQKKHLLVDLSVNGMCFLVDSGKEFPIGTIMSGCELVLNEDSIKCLKGKVVHNSSESVDSDHDMTTQWLCGVTWSDLDSKKEELIESVVKVLKKRNLSENNISDIGE